LLQFKDNWSLTNEDRIEQALHLKQKGTHYYKLQNFKLALKFYKKMNYYLKNDISGGYFCLVYFE